MFAPARLDTGLLISAKHIIARSQGFAFPAALVEVQYSAGLEREGGVPWEYPAAMTPGSQRVLTEPAPKRGATDATSLCATPSRRNSASDQRAKGSPRRDGNSQASALTSTMTPGGKTRWPPAAWLVFKTG